MIDAIIIGHNEGKYIQDMYDKLCPQTFINRIWVSDRCTDDTNEQLTNLGDLFISTKTLTTGRHTSFCRNLGVKLSDPNNDVLFLDGDRVPVSGDLHSLLSTNTDITLLKLENDSRDNITDYQHTSYGEVLNGFFSCGILIKRPALNKIMEFQSGQVFDESLQHIWGVEDTYLGDVCYHLGLTADIHPNIRLRGSFDKEEFDDFEALKLRFKKRDLLNVKW